MLNTVRAKITISVVFFATQLALMHKDLPAVSFSNVEKKFMKTPFKISS